MKPIHHLEWVEALNNLSSLLSLSLFWRVGGWCAVHQMAYQAPLPGMAVEAAWVPVCAEGLTWRQLPLLF